VESVAGMVWNTHTGHPFAAPARYFRFQTEMDYGVVAGRALRQFTEEVMHQHPGAYITMRNWRNTSYHSWQMEQ